MSQKVTIQKKMTILLGVFLTCLFLYGIGRIYGFVLFPDEFGYWASAAQAIGYDWNEIASLGSYYSFGYSLLLIPILLLVPDSVMAYRTAVGLNVVLLFLTLLLLIQIIQKLIPNREKIYHVLFAGVAVFYPTWLFYMQTTLAEIVMVFSFSLVCWLFLKYVEQGKLYQLCLLILALFYLYIVHMRNVAVLIAAFLVFGMKLIKEKKINKQVICLIVLAIAGVLVANGLKELVQGTVYGNASEQALAGNDYAGQWHKIKSLFTLEGIEQFLVSLIGKIYYLGMASFGLFYFGIFYIGKKAFLTLKELFTKRQDGVEQSNNIQNGHGYFYIFLLLSVIGVILINAIYTKGSGRIDAMLYGRYDEQILPVVMALGMYQLWKNSAKVKHCLMAVAGMVVSGLFMTAVIEKVVIDRQLTNIHGGYFIAGMSYLLKYISFEPENYFWKACLLSSVFILIFAVVMIAIRKVKGLEWLVLLLIGMEIMLGIGLSEQHVYHYNGTTYGNTQLAEIIAVKEEQGRRIVSYGNNGDDAFVSSIQFILRDTKITLVSEEEKDLLTDSDVVIISSKQKDVDFLNERYAECDAYGAFWLYYTD